jgi:uncharacterized delta-60 repeat protein
MRLLHRSRSIDRPSSKTKHRGKSRTRAFRPELELLEERTMLNAADLDPTFGSGGKAIPGAGTLYAMALQSDGKIVAVGPSSDLNSEFEVMRLTQSGQLDQSFGIGGIVTTAFPDEPSATAVGVAIQTDGKIVVAGNVATSSANHIALARYNPDGSLDKSFGPNQNGLVVTLGSGPSATSVAIDPINGRIIVGGHFANYAYVDRFNSSGFEVDDSGYNFGSNPANNAVFIEPDERVVFAGHDSVGLPSSKYLIIRNTRDDFLDTNFNSTGYVTGSVSDSYRGFSDNDGRAITVQPDGKIIIVGNALDQNGKSNVIVARYNDDGTIDTSFNQTGQLAFNIGNDDAAQSVQVQQDGKIVIAGIFGLPNAGFLVTRLNSDGSFDTTFGDGGSTVIHVSPGDSNENANALLIQPDGKIVVGGFIASASSTSFAVVRLVGGITNGITAQVLPLNLSENVPFTGAVGTLSDTDGNTDSGQYNATITWGDGNTSTATLVSEGGGLFAINGSHTYARVGRYTLSVSIADADGASAQAADTETVADQPLTAKAAPLPGATDSQPVGGVVATFTDADPGAVAQDYTATIQWGDGGLDAVQVGTGSSGFTVGGEHTYSVQGTYTITVTIQDYGGSQAVVSSQIVITDPPLSASFVPFSGTDGAAAGGTVASFTDPDPLVSVSGYRATIAWGDGNTSTGVVAADAHGGFTVSGTNAYAVQGSYSVTVAIFDQGGASATVQGTVTITDPALKTMFVPFSGTDGQPAGGAIVDFTDSDPNGNLGQYHSVITWGDGTTSAGALAADGHGGFTVSGTNAYARAGSYAVDVAISDAGGTTADARGAITITDPTPLMVFIPPAPTAAIPFSGVVATFTDPDPNGRIGDYTADINWGDGSSSSGTVVSDGKGGFNVTGAHTYDHEGIAFAGVTLVDKGGSAAAMDGRVIVADAPLTATAASFNAGVNVPLYGLVADFKDADPRGTTSILSATIDWGDGVSSPGSIVADGHGGFLVNGGHTYVTVGAYKLKVSISDLGGAVAAPSGAVGIEPALRASGRSVNAAPQQPFSGVVAVFSGGDPLNGAASYSATVTWADGSSSTGFVTADPTGGFDVSSARLAPAIGTSTFSVSIRDNEGGFASASGTINVAPPPQTLAFSHGATREVYAVTASGNLFGHVDSLGWNLIGAGILSIGVSTEDSGNAVVFAVTADNALFRFDNASGWAMIGAPHTVLWATAGTDSNGLADAFVFTTAGDFGEYRRSSGWLIIGGRGTILAASAAASDQVAVVTADQRIAEFSLRTGWQSLTGPGFAALVSAVSEASGRFVIQALSPSGSASWYGSTGNWVPLGSPGVSQALSAGTDRDGYADLYVLAADGSLKNYNITSGWLSVPQAGPGSVRAMTAGDQNLAIIINSSGAVLEYSDALGWLPLSASGFTDN